MACSLLPQHHNHYLFFVQSPNYYFSLNRFSYSPNQTVSPSTCLTKRTDDNSSRFRKIQKLSANKNTNDTPQKPKSLVTDHRVNGRELDPDPDPDSDGVSGSSVSNSSLSALLHRFGDEFKLDGLGMDILSIALPAALALAADPIASLVDTGFVGHLGSAELAAVGVSGAVFNLVSKLFNVPLLNITTSFVAEEQASVTKVTDGYRQTSRDQQDKIFLPSVSTSIMIAAALGIIEAVALSTGSSYLMNTMGIPVDSPMRMPAEQFLSLRAFGAPPIVVALAAQGTFRGFKDTKTPLFAVGAGNLLNAILDPILIFFFGLGIGGAAISTVISEYVFDSCNSSMETQRRSTTCFSK